MTKMTIIYAIIVATHCAFRSTQKGLLGKVSHFIANLTLFSEVKCAIALAAKKGCSIIVKNVTKH